MMEEYMKASKDFMRQSPFIDLLEIDLMELSETTAIGRMPFKKEFENPYGSMHGGCLYALADTVAGTLANTSGKVVTTVEGNLHYLEPARNTEYIYCEATMVRCGKNLVTVNADVKDDKGKLLDCGYFTFFKTNMDLIPQKL